MYAFTPKAPCDASNGPTDTSTKGRRPGLTSMVSCNILCDEPPVGAAQDHSDHTNTFLWYLAALASERNRSLPSHMANLESMLVQCGWFELVSSIFKGSPFPVAANCRFLHYPLLLLPLAHPWGASPEFWGRATSFGMTLIILEKILVNHLGTPFKLQNYILIILTYCGVMDAGSPWWIRQVWRLEKLTADLA